MFFLVPNAIPNFFDLFLNLLENPTFTRNCFWPPGPVRQPLCPPLHYGLTLISTFRDIFCYNFDHFDHTSCICICISVIRPLSHHHNISQRIPLTILNQQNIRKDHAKSETNPDDLSDLMLPRIMASKRKHDGEVVWCSQAIERKQVSHFWNAFQSRQAPSAEQRKHLNWFHLYK